MRHKKKFNFTFLLIFFSFFLSTSASAAFEIAITFDDLPGAGVLPIGQSRVKIADTIMAVLKKHNVPGVYGFVIGEGFDGEPKGPEILQTWVKNGYLLGNHTYSHFDLSQRTATEYNNDIKMDDTLLAPYIADKNPKYFRYPYLSEGNTKTKRDAVRHFLFENNYQVAPVTMNFFDYLWNQAYYQCLLKNNQQGVDWLRKSFMVYALEALKNARNMSHRLYGRDIKYILLLHLGPFDAVMLDDLLTAYEKQGAKFISFEDALSDSFYKINPNMVGNTGCDYLTWLSFGTCRRNFQDFNLIKRSYCQ